MVDSQDRDLLPSHSSRRDICHVCPDVSGRRRCHFLSLTERFCDVLLIMHQGICVEQVAMEEILRHSKDVLYPPSARSRWRRIKAKRGCEEMNSHFFTAPFYFAFIWFRVQGSGLSWRLRRLFLEDGILVSQPSPLGNAIKLSGRTFLAPHRGSCPEG